MKMCYICFFEDLMSLVALDLILVVYKIFKHQSHSHLLSRLLQLFFLWSNKIDFHLKLASFRSAEGIYGHQFV